MEIIPIFAPHLYAISYPKTYTTVWDEEICSYFEEEEIGEIDEFERCFELWSNPLYLYNYFDKNERFLNNSFWKNISIEDAAKITKQKALEFEVLLTENNSDIESLFRPLDNRQIKFAELIKGKSKYNCLRLYAIKIDSNRFLITGGAIKLTNKMEEHASTRNELKKLEKIKNYLVALGVIDGDSFDEILYEIRL
jgi:hypothetical protein